MCFSHLPGFSPLFMAGPHSIRCRSAPNAPTSTTSSNPPGAFSTCSAWYGHLACRLALRCRLKTAPQVQVFMSWNPVYSFVQQIPRGRVLTYGAVAKALRLRGGARAAGHAMAACPSGKGIPWHRVVGFGGKLLIREPYASLQRKLLESEGVRMTERRVDMKRHQWVPLRAAKSTKNEAKRRRTPRKRPSPKR